MAVMMKTCVEEPVASIFHLKLSPLGPCTPYTEEEELRKGEGEQQAEEELSVVSRFPPVLAGRGEGWTSGW
jgi:hypothetical protein